MGVCTTWVYIYIFPLSLVPSPAATTAGFLSTALAHAHPCAEVPLSHAAGSMAVKKPRKTSPDSIQAAGLNGIIVVALHEKTRQPELTQGSCMLLRRSGHGIWGGQDASRHNHMLALLGSRY